MFELHGRTRSPLPLELDGILPETIRGLQATHVAKLSVLHGNRRVELGQFFDVRPSRHHDLHFFGDLQGVHGLGTGLTTGSIVVDGDVGRRTGAGMRGGQLTIRGNAGDWLACELQGGAVHVTGSVGHRAGGAFIGSRQGMTGGRIRIGGHAGDELGLLMRRGLIVVGGRSGGFTGASMIAGTVWVMGGMGFMSGAGMKRGTLISRSSSVTVSSGFRYSCEYRPGFLPILRSSLDVETSEKSVSCYRGDVLTGGRGELWLLDDA